MARYAGLQADERTVSAYGAKRPERGEGVASGNERVNPALGTILNPSPGKGFKKNG